MLTPLIPLLEKKLKAKAVLRIVPQGLKEKEQINLLKIISEEVTKGINLELDITHAYRHPAARHGFKSGYATKKY